MADDTWRRNDPEDQGVHPPRYDDRGPSSYRERPHYEEPHRGVLLLVLGIISLTVCALTGPFAWMMSNADLKKMDAGQMDPEGRGLTQAGKITGLIGTIFLILSCVFVIIYIVFIAVLIGAAGAR